MHYRIEAITLSVADVDRARAFYEQAGWHLDLDTEVFAFKGWAEGRTALSWNGTFSTRLANSVKWRSERGVTPKPASAVYDDAPFYKDPAR